MGHACVAYACTLVLLCPLAFSEEFVFGSGDNFQEILGTGDKSLVSDENLQVKNRPLWKNLNINITRRKRQTNEYSDNDYAYEDEGDDEPGDYDQDDGEGHEQATTRSGVTTSLNNNLDETSTSKILDSRKPSGVDQNSRDKKSPETSKKTPGEWPENHPPNLKPNIKTLAITVTAGKAFSNIIPADLFYDPEDGVNLTLTMHETDNTKLGKDSWIQFLPFEREVYGLPLEWDIGRWKLKIVARDSEGLTAQCPLDITVEEHKETGAINHKFFLDFKLNHPFENSIDWQIRALEGIVNLFGDGDMEKLTVLDANQTEDFCEFVWTNDTIQRDGTECPIEDIMDLWRIVADDSGAPSVGVIAALAPELAVRGARWEGRGPCAMPPAHAAPAGHSNLLTVTAGHLFIHSIPNKNLEGARDLSLRMSDGSESPPTHWLQWNRRRRELFGVPTLANVGTSVYKLVPDHPHLNKAHDEESLVIRVEKPPPIKPAAEFHITLNYSFVDLKNNATNKRKLIEHLASIFGQEKTNNIRIVNIAENPTTVIWYNTSLPTDICPVEEVKTLYNIIRNEKQGLIENPFNITSTRIVPLGVCADASTEELGTMFFEVAASSGQLGSPEYGYSDGYSGTDTLITFIVPTVILLSVFLILTIFASVMYKKSVNSPRGYPRVGVNRTAA